MELIWIAIQTTKQHKFELNTTTSEQSCKLEFSFMNTYLFVLSSGILAVTLSKL